MIWLTLAFLFTYTRTRLVLINRDISANAVIRNVLNFLGQNRWGHGSVSLSWLSVFQVSKVLELPSDALSVTRACSFPSYEAYRFLFSSFQWVCSPCFASFRWQSGQKINTTPTYENSRIIQVLECQLFLFCCKTKKKKRKKKRRLTSVLHGTSRRKSWWIFLFINLLPKNN